MVSRVIDFAPDATMRAVLALNRYLGFRVPSEIRTLTWADVDFSPHDPHLKITATKTEHHIDRGIRTAPILPVLRPYLEDLASIFKPGVEVPLSDPVFVRFVDASDAAIRSATLKILKRAKIKPWPNLFSNGRKSAITDLLAAGHAVADVADRVGNSPSVIWEFYAISTAEARRRAATVGIAVPSSDVGPQMGPNQAQSGLIQTDQDGSNMAKTTSFADSGGS